MTTASKPATQLCTTCGQALPFAPPAPVGRTARWVCLGCGTGYDATLSVENFTDALRQVRPCALEFDREHLVHPPSAIARFLKHLVDDSTVGCERRRSPRYPVVIPAVAQPFTSSFCPTGLSFMALTRDISVTGLALVHTRAVPAEFLALELPAGKNEKMQLLMRVLRCQPFHHLYEIAGRFLVRLDGEKPLPP